MDNTIARIFPGSEVWCPKEPSKRICLLKDIVVHGVLDQIGYVCKVDMEGVEIDIDNPLDSAPVMDRYYRIYACMNCGWQCDGGDTFKEVRQHLGKRNPFVHPFMDSL